MSEQDSKRQPGGGVRRVGHKDRKKTIETRGPLFPPEEEFDFEEALKDDEEAAQPEAVVTPPAERFPPVNPSDPPAPVPVQRDIRPRSTFLPNLIAILFLIATLAMIGLIAIIWADPYTPLNPLAPPTPLPIVITTTPLPATATLPPTAGPTPSFTPLSAEALTPAAVVLSPPPSFTPALFPFTLVEAGVVYVPNGNGEGCNWSSIAGSVTDLQGQPLNGYEVHMRGENEEISVFSGSALTYGPGGFELPLSGAPLAAQYTVQLLNPSGAPVSDEYSVETRESCDENVAIVSFVQNRAL
jgi:hypothetical protein